MLVNLQVLRALAASMVLFHHLIANLTGDPRGPASFGRYGVDVFFVISGFIMVYTTQSGTTSTGSFLTKRLIRIVPLYWLLTLAIFTAYLVFRSPPPLEYLVKSLLFIPYGDDPLAHRPLIFLGWTLNFEMFFYLVFAMFVGWKSVVSKVATVSLLLIGFLILGRVLPIQIFAVQVLASPLLIEFIAGMILALVFLRHDLRLSMGMGTAVTLAILGLMALNFDSGDSWRRILVMGSLSVSLVATALAMERGGSVISNRLAVLLGSASYSLYLTHPYILRGLNFAAKKVFGPGDLSFLVTLVAAPVLCAAIAIAFFLMFERPITDFLRKLSARPQATPVEQV